MNHEDICVFEVDQIGSCVTLTDHQIAMRFAKEVTEAIIEIVGAALYIHWNDVNEQAKAAYRKKIRAALESALNG